MPPGPFRDALGARGIRAQQVYATADVGSIAYESEARAGLIVDEGVLVEIVRAGTGDSLPAGEVGEVVVTLLSNQEYPLIRFGTGDLSAIEPSSLSTASPCGRTRRCASTGGACTSAPRGASRCSSAPPPG